MFNDVRSKKIILVAHCVLNQNSISDGTADLPASMSEIVDLLQESHIGIIQMPCPELLCLGLDRGNIHGSEQPVVIENTRIRQLMCENSSLETLGVIVNQLIYQIEEYLRFGFKILGIVGINRSPSCGVETTSINNQEVQGEGVFIDHLHKELIKRNIHLKMIGIKSSDKNFQFQKL